MGIGDNTVMGGSDGQFHTTQWTQILASQTNDGQARSSALGSVMGHYWKPVYCYLRRKGYDNEKSKDLAQGFFTEIVMGRELVAKANPDTGRFRGFLLRALNNYLTSEWRKQSAAKRMPESGLLSLDGIEGPSLPDPNPQTSPDAAFAHAWATELLRNVLDNVRRQCIAANQETHWNIFHGRVVEPILNDTPIPPLPELCVRFGVSKPEQASAMQVTVKRKFHSALRSEVRRYVASDTEVDDEIAELMTILSNGA